MSIQDRKDWERAQRRARIVDVAEALFLQVGYTETTLPAIAAAAGYNKRNLYFYFKDKEALFLAVVERALTRLKDRLAQAPAPQADAPANLARLARAFFDYAMTQPQELALVMRYETAHYVYDPAGLPMESDPTRLACQRLSDDTSAIVRAILSQGQQAGSVRRDLAPRPLMLLLWGQILGVVQVLRMREKGFRQTFGLSREALFARFVEMIADGLRPSAGV